MKVFAWIPLMYIKHNLVIKDTFITNGWKKTRKYCDPYAGNRLLLARYSCPNRPSAQRIQPCTIKGNTMEEIWYAWAHKLFVIPAHTLLFSAYVAYYLSVCIYMLLAAYKQTVESIYHYVCVSQHQNIVMTSWKRFPHYWPFVGESTSHR